MANPLPAEEALKALKNESLDVREFREWSKHNRAGHGMWGPVHGVMIHHTVTKGSKASVELCYDGSSSLPGPLCHAVIDKEGLVHLVGWGRANHAGLGDAGVLRAVIREDKLPKKTYATVDGNARFYGFECVNLGNGNDPWPQKQIDAMVGASAALCRAHGWNERSVLGHKEWQPGKVDPKGIDMDDFRARVAERLKD